jgi:hypothetical protein
LSKKDTKPISRAEGAHHLYGNGIHHYTWSNGITTLEVMPFASADTPPPNDLEFTALLEGDLASVIYSCIWQLSNAGFFKTASCRNGYLSDGTPFIKPRDWLYFEAKSDSGSVLFEALRDIEVDQDDNVLDPFDLSGKKVPLIAVAARLVWEDQCKRGEMFSEIWYCAKIIEMWFWPSSSIIDRAVLIGQLYAEMNIKYVHEEDAMKGKKFKGGAKQAKNATDQKKRDRLARSNLVEAELLKLSEAELSQFRTKSTDRIRAKSLARFIQHRLCFEEAHVRPINLEQIAKIIQEVHKK